LEFLIDKKDLICTKDGSYYNFKLDIIEGYYLLNIYDVTSYYMQTEKIKDIAMKDELTGLYNRKKLDISINEFINKNICVILFDVDNFKQVNDTYGHLKGDEVLKMIAKVVKENVRSSDLVVRWGGEEFIVILEQLNDIEIAKNLAEKLRIKIAEQNIEEVGHVTCSFGISCGYVESKPFVNHILEKSDEALYKAKREGKNRVELN
jgi:diguanylate cyclase (GGDEF)-like protein